MGFYRLYFMDREGHISGVREVEADDDVQAIGRAGRMGRGEVRELWLDAVRLGRWDSDAFGQQGIQR